MIACADDRFAHPRSLAGHRSRVTLALRTHARSRAHARFAHLRSFALAIACALTIALRTHARLRARAPTIARALDDRSRSYDRSRAGRSLSLLRSLALRRLSWCYRLLVRCRWVCASARADQAALRSPRRRGVPHDTAFSSRT